MTKTLCKDWTIAGVLGKAYDYNTGGDCPEEVLSI